MTYKITAIAFDNTCYGHIKAHIANTKLRDISIVIVRSIDDWTYNTTVSAIFLLDGTGKVIDYVLGFNEKSDDINRIMNVLAEQSRIEREAKMPKRFSVQTKPPYKVGDYFCENGVDGVVFEVDSTGMIGKILSLDAKQCQWYNASKGGKTTHATSITDGEANMRQVKSLKMWQNMYPAHAWCDAKGDGWYLPAKEELHGVLSERERINYALLQVGGDALYTDRYNRYYRSSTEIDKKVVAVDCFYGDNDSRGEIHQKIQLYNHVRAVRRF